MAINPNKLSKNFEVNTSIGSELRLYWNSPSDLSYGEESVITRRKDAFPVELRNRNFEDRYTDVTQVEVFRGSPIYCSHLIPNGNNTLIVSDDNSIIPSMPFLERDNKYTGRLIRDSLSQVFRITGNTNIEIFYESISVNLNNQVDPIEGSFVILADFTKSRRTVQTLSLLPNSNTLTVTINSFVLGDQITLNNAISLIYGTHWTAGASSEETASNIIHAMINSGVKYTYSQFGSTILLQRNSENTLSVVSTNINAKVITYGAALGNVFVNKTLNMNELRNLVLQDGDLNFNHIKSNLGNYIELYTDLLTSASDVNILDSHNNTFPSGLIDTYRSETEAIRKKGSGLEDDTFYYYTAFTTPLTSLSITYNEANLLGEDPLPYTVDKLAPYYVRVTYESLKYVNKDIGTYTYNSLTGDIQFLDGRNLSLEDISIGYMFADSVGRRNAIIDISNLATGSFKLTTGLTLGTNPQVQLHGSVTLAQVPVGFSNIEVGDTFKDIAGNSFTIFGTRTHPLSGMSIPSGNAFDVGQGLIDKSVLINPFLVPFTYDPTNGRVQYGERSVAQNSQLSPYIYNSANGLVTYSTNIDLRRVEVGQSFIDGAGSYFIITSVNPTLLQIGLATSLIIDTTVNNRQSGSVISIEGFKDIDGTPLVTLSEVHNLDLFKTNSKADYIIISVDAQNGRLYIEPNLDSISLLVHSEFDGSCYRRGADVAWIGYKGENLPTLNNSNLGAVRRYNSVNNTQFAYFSNILSTQAFAISAKNNDIVKLLYKWWPSVFRDLDTSGDLEALMGVFGYKFNEIYSLISTFELQNASIIQPSQLEVASVQSGLSEVSETLGIDTRRRIMKDMISCWKLKGSRDGLFKFIKVLTTWDITNGTGDVRKAIVDTTPELTGLRHYSPALGSLNTNIVDTTAVQSPPAGRFVKGIPGFNLEGFFKLVQIQIELPNVALYVGNSTSLAQSGSTTILQDSAANFDQVNSLKGCFLIPMEGSPNDYYEILSNDIDTITVAGVVPQSILGNKYVVLTPLNLNRFVAIQTTIVEMLSYRSVAVFTFTVKTI
jgi:hypothetical protein